MAKKYQEYALLPLSQYNTYKQILDNDISELEHRLINIILHENLSIDEKVSKFLTILVDHDQNILSKVNKDTIEGENSLENTEIQKPSEAEENANFGHLSNCFAPVPQTEPDLKHPTQLANTSSSSAGVKKVSLQLSPTAPSVLDSSKILQREKEQLLSEIRNKLEKPSEHSSDIKKEEVGKDSVNTRKSSREKKTPQWRNYYN